MRTSASFARIVSCVVVGVQSCIIVLGTRSTATIFGSPFSLGTAGIDFFQTDLTVFIGIQFFQQRSPSIGCSGILRGGHFIRTDVAVGIGVQLFQDSVYTFVQHCSASGKQFIRRNGSVLIGIELIQNMTMATASGAGRFKFIFGQLPVFIRIPTGKNSQQTFLDGGCMHRRNFIGRDQNQIIILYAVSDPRGFEPHTFFFGRTLPNEYSKLSDTSELMWRVVPSTLEQPDIIDSWDLSTSTQIEEGRDREDHRRPPPFDGFERPRQGGPPGGPRGGPGGGRREFTPPLASSVMQQGVSLSANHITLEDGKKKSLAFSTLNDPEAQESVRIEFLLSREFPETIESTIRSISRNSVGAGLLIVMFTMIVLSEMRRRRKAEATLTDRNQLLDEANHRKDRLLAIISHDLRAPLSGVSNLSGLLMKAPESFTPEEIRKFAGEIQSTSKHLTELLDNLLNWARLQTGQLPYFPGRIDLERVAHQVTTLFASAAKEQDVRLNTLIEKHPAFVNDIEMLRTILRNLLSNAIRHSRKGGDLLLRCEQVDNKMRIDVKDTGEGMTASQVAALFQLPDKPRDPTEVGKTGAGFGLVLSKKLAHRMGGDLVVQSEPGTGSTFRLEVPMQWTPKGFKDDKPSEGQKPSTAS